MLHPLVIEGLKLNETKKSESVKMVRGETIAFQHPRSDDVVIEDAKALGIHNAPCLLPKLEFLM